MNAPKEIHTILPALDAEDITECLGRLPEWRLANSRLVKSFHFGTSAVAEQFINRLCETAEDRNHHPHLHWFKRDVSIELYTHKSNGLTVRDFEFAACCDALSRELL